MSRIRELKANVRYLQDYRKQLPAYIDQLEVQLAGQGLSYYDIQQKEREFLKGQSAEEWLKYCDKKIGECRQELTDIRLSRAKWVSFSILIIFLGLAFAVMMMKPAASPAGLVTLEEIAPNAAWQDIAKSPWAGWEPIAAYSADMDYANYIGYRNDIDRYYLVYLGDDMNLTYVVNPNPPGMAPQIFRAIYVNTTHAGEDYFFRFNREGLKLYLNGQSHNPWDNDGISRTLISHTMNSDNISIVYNFSLAGDWVRIRIDYTIKGKVLKAHISSDQGKVSSIQFTSTGGEGQEEYVTTEMSFTSDLKYAVGKGDLFMKIYNDIDASSASLLAYYQPVKNNASTTNLNAEIKYSRNSEGQLQRLNELLYFVVTPELIEAFPQIPNPESPYRSYMADKVVLDFWAINASFNNYYLYSKRLHDYGMRDLHVIVDAWGKGPWPEFAPLGDSAAASFRKMISDHNALGFNVSAYTIWQDIYEGSVYYGDEYCMHYANGSIMNGWCGSLECTCPLKYDRRLEVATAQVPIIHSYGTVGELSDAIGNELADKYVDMDADGNINGMFKNNLKYQRELLTYLKHTQNGPVSSEGYAPIFFAGYLDAYDAVSSCCTNAQADPVVVDYVHRQLRRKASPYAGYYRIFFPIGNNYYYKGITDTDIDRYITTNLAYGHTGRIDSTAPWMHDISDRTVVRIYYMWKALQEEYALYDATDIRYYSNSQWKTLSEAMKDSYDFVNAQIRVNYSSGLVLYANRHSSSSLTVSHLGTAYTIPPSGWLAYNANIFEFSGLLDGDRVDIAETEDYTYIDTRGKTKTIALHDPYNYTSKTLGVGTLSDYALQLALVNNRTTFTASVPLILYRQNNTLGCPRDYECGGWSSCSDGLQQRECSCSCESCIGDSSEQQTCIMPEPPVISNIEVNPLSVLTTRIAWSTDMPADSAIYYRTTGDYATAQNQSLTQNHSITLSLSPNTTYNYHVSSTALSGLSAQSAESSFTTPAYKVLLPSDLQVSIDGSTDIARLFTDVKDVYLMKDSSIIAMLSHDFADILDLRDVRITVNATSASISNLHREKTVYISAASKACASNEPMNLSFACNQSQELLVSCPGSNGEFSCSLSSQMELTGDIGAAQQYLCSEQFECTDWSACINSVQTRICSCPCATCQGDDSTMAACIPLLPPVISGISHSPISVIRTKISWTTDSLADSTVRYGTASGSYTLTEAESSMSVLHEIVLDVEAGTTYYYIVQSTNANGMNQSSEYSFTTPGYQIEAPPDLDIVIDGSTDTSRIFSGTEEVMLQKLGVNTVKIEHDFSTALDLSDVSINISGTSITITGLHLNKTVYLNNSLKTGKVCVKDSSTSLSSLCNHTAEYMLDCPGANATYSCQISGDYYLITGLMHSIAAEFQCTEEWLCADWSGCDAGKMRRECSCACGAGCTGDGAVEKDCSSGSSSGSTGGSSGGSSGSSRGSSGSSGTQSVTTPVSINTSSSEEAYQELPDVVAESNQTETSVIEVPVAEYSNYAEVNFTTESPRKPSTKSIVLKFERPIFAGTMIMTLLNVLLWTWHRAIRRRMQARQLFR